MRTADVIQTAWSNLRRNKTRSILTIIAVFVGATTIMLTNGIGDGIKSYLDGQLGSLGAGNVLVITQKSTETNQDASQPQKFNPDKVKSQASYGGATAGPESSPFLLTQNDLEIIKSDASIKSVSPLQNLSIDYITTGQDKFVIEAQPARAGSLKYDLAAGTQLDNSTKEHQVLLPTFYLAALGFGDAESAINKEVTVALSDQTNTRKEFTVVIVGVANKSLIASNSLLLNRSFSDETVAFQNTGKPEEQKNLYTAAFAEFDKDYIEQQVTDLKNRLSDKGYSAVTIKDQQALIYGIIDGVVIVLNMFGIVALTAASFGIINTLYMAVQERTKEIGLMKAVGMSKGKIFGLFSIEAALLGLIGSSLAVIAANALGRVINNVAAQGFLADFEGLTLLSFQWQSVVGIMAIVTTIAFLAGTLPARKASKLDPIEALRYE